MVESSRQSKQQIVSGDWGDSGATGMSKQQGGATLETATEGSLTARIRQTNRFWRTEVFLPALTWDQRLVKDHYSYTSEMIYQTCARTFKPVIINLELCVLSLKRKKENTTRSDPMYITLDVCLPNAVNID